MKTKKYPKLKIVGTYQSVNWQELYNFFKDLYNPLSLREFRGYVEDVLIGNYETRHWSADKEKKGFGELIILNAGKSWRRFNIKFYDSSDNDRFINLEIDSINKKIIFSCSLDNRDKLINTWEKIRAIFNSFKILKQEGILNKNLLLDFIFKKKYWVICIVIIFAIFYNQLDWQRISDLKYWINEKLGLPFKDVDVCHYTTLEIAELADRALWEGTKNCGDRAIYENLIKCFDQTGNPEIKEQIQRIVDDYRTSILVRRVDAIEAVCQYGSMIGDKCTKEPVEGFTAKNVVEHLDIKNYSRCTSRARAACILRNIKTAPDKDKRDMNEVLKTLVFIMNKDPSLLVSKLALDRYSQFTGFSPSDVFDFKDAIDHFDKRIEQGQPLLLPEYDFRTDERP